MEKPMQKRSLFIKSLALGLFITSTASNSMDLLPRKSFLVGAASGVALVQGWKLACKNDYFAQKNKALEAFFENMSPAQKVGLYAGVFCLGAFVGYLERFLAHDHAVMILDPHDRSKQLNCLSEYNKKQLNRAISRIIG